MSERPVDEPPVRVHQLVFGSSDRSLLGGAGMGPIAASIGGPTLAAWSRLCNDGDLLLGGWADIDASEVRPVLGALLLGEAPALGVALHLVPARDGGRPSHLLHVLIGPPDVVDGRLVLGLHDWAGWALPERPPPAELPVLSSAELRAASAAGRARLPGPPPGDALIRLAADVVAQPDARYRAVFSGSDSALALTAALLDRVSGVAGDEEWTVLVGGAANVARAEPRLHVTPAQQPPRAGRAPRLELRYAQDTADAEKPPGATVDAARTLLAERIELPRGRRFRDPLKLISFLTEIRHRIRTPANLLRQVADGTADRAVVGMLRDGDWRLRIEEALPEFEDELLVLVLRQWARFAETPWVLDLIRTETLDRCLRTDESTLYNGLRATTPPPQKSEVSAALSRWAKAGPIPADRYDVVLGEVLGRCGSLGYLVSDDKANRGLLRRVGPKTLLSWSRDNLELAATGQGRALELVLDTWVYLTCVPAAEPDSRERVAGVLLVADRLAESAFGIDGAGPLYRELVRIGCGGPEDLDVVRLRALLADLKQPPSRRLVTVLAAKENPMVRLLTAAALGDSAMFGALETRTLVSGAVAWPKDADLVSGVLSVLRGRFGDRDLGPLLARNGYLTEAVRQLYTRPPDRIEAHRGLLVAAYGERLDGTALTAVLDRAGPPDEALLAAALPMAADGAVPDIAQRIVLSWFEALGVETRRSGIWKALQPPEPEPVPVPLPPPAPAPAPWPQFPDPGGPPPLFGEPQSAPETAARAEPEPTEQQAALVRQHDADDVGPGVTRKQLGWVIAAVVVIVAGFTLLSLQLGGGGGTDQTPPPADTPTLVQTPSPTQTATPQHGTTSAPSATHSRGTSQ